ncbi:hypothetical protein V3N99_03550 [Dermatophilaceae bacterium Soc4.6]
MSRRAAHVEVVAIERARPPGSGHGNGGLAGVQRRALERWVAVQSALVGHTIQLAADGVGDARAGSLTLLDRGDALLGNPVLDVRAFVERLEGADLQALLDPVAELVAATTYQRFLAGAPCGPGAQRPVSGTTSSGPPA